MEGVESRRRWGLVGGTCSLWRGIQPHFTYTFDSSCELYNRRGLDVGAFVITP